MRFSPTKCVTQLQGKITLFTHFKEGIGWGKENLAKQWPMIKNQDFGKDYP